MAFTDLEEELAEMFGSLQTIDKKAFYGGIRGQWIRRTKGKAPPVPKAVVPKPEKPKRPIRYSRDKAGRSVLRRDILKEKTT